MYGLETINTDLSEVERKKSIFKADCSVFCILKRMIELLHIYFQAHENRVKDICGFLPNNIKHACQNEVWLVSVCSNGKLKIWKFDGEMLSDEEQEPTGKNFEYA